MSLQKISHCGGLLGVSPHLVDPRNEGALLVRAHVHKVTCPCMQQGDSDGTCRETVLGHAAGRQ